MKVFALQHLRDGIFRGQADEIVGGELREPAAIEIHYGLLAVQNLEDLRLVGFRVARDFFRRKRRTGGRASRGVADHAGEIADEENERVTHVLKMFQLAVEHWVAYV